jgi:hypothetical protein
VTLTYSTRLSVTQIDLRLTPDSEAVMAARHSLDRLEGDLPPEKLEDVRLVVSELVTNSVRHAGISPDEHILLAGGDLQWIGAREGMRPRPRLREALRAEAEDRLKWWVGPAHRGEYLRSLGGRAQRLRVREVRDRLRHHPLSS